MYLKILGCSSVLWRWRLLVGAWVGFPSRLFCQVSQFPAFTVHVGVVAASIRRFVSKHGEFGTAEVRDGVIAAAEVSYGGLWTCRRRSWERALGRKMGKAKGRLSEVSGHEGVRRWSSSLSKAE